MPLHILLPLVVIGITSIGVILHVMGKTRPVSLTADTARAAWLRAFPDDSVHAVNLAEDQHAALVEATSGTGLVWSFGADIVARPLTDARLSHTGKGLRIHFNDYAAPGVTVHLSDTTRDHWQERINAT